MSKTFAPDTPRDDQGRLVFPPDNRRRRELFVPESFDHPARAQVFMVEALIEYLSEPGDMVADPFGGSGTLLAGLVTGRDVTLIELNPEYIDLCHKNMDYVCEQFGESPIPTSVILAGPNQEHLKSMSGVQAFIFSPPYAGALAGGGGKLADWGGYTPERRNTYSDTQQVQGNWSPYNLGVFNNFMFNQEMKKVYKLCLDALKPGGFTACIIKDRIAKGVKDELGYRAFQDMLILGYEAYDWQRLYMAGSHYTKWHRAQGTKTIDEEHIIICRKPLAHPPSQRKESGR